MTKYVICLYALTSWIWSFLSLELAFLVVSGSLLSIFPSTHKYLCPNVNFQKVCGRLPQWSSGSEFALQCRGCSFNPWLGKQDPMYQGAAKPACCNHWSSQTAEAMCHYYRVLKLEWKILHASTKTWCIWINKKKKKNACGSGHTLPGQPWSCHNILGHGCPRIAHQSRQQSESTDNSLPPLMNLNKEHQLGTIFLCVCVCLCVSHSAVSDSLQPHGS